jgi:oligopeptidase A
MSSTQSASSDTNPLLQQNGLPLFDQIKPEHVKPAIETLLLIASQALEDVTAPSVPAEWQAISKVLDVATERLSLAWGVVSHLNSVADSQELRAAYNESLPLVTEFWTRLGADERLYAKYKWVNISTLNTAQKQALENALRNFILGGAALQGEAKLRYANIQERLAELSQKFSENALDATDKFSLIVQEAELDGVPEDVKTTARVAAEKDGHTGYQLSLKMPCYLPVMQFANNGDLRQKLYKAFVTRASDQSDAAFAAFDNTQIIQEILQLRKEEAQLLGYQNYAEVSVATKMADTPEKVISFLRDLAKRARPYAQKDLEEMRQFSAQYLNIQNPQSWDWPFISEKLKEAKFSFSEQEVKQYFPAPKVLEGLFKIIETLFEVNIRPDQAPVWHSSVGFYRIERNGHLVGQFYLDPPARAGKRGGAWMDDVRSRWLRPENHQLQTPVAHLVCNFADSVDGQAPLLTHDDVITLFHEFGHGLHHMLTKVDERDVSGFSGVEWDAVELPSQFMENFCWEWSVIKHMTSHVQTNEPLPKALFDKMVAAKNFQSGWQTLRQIELGLMDMLLHTEHDPQDDIMPLLDKVRAEVSVNQVPAFNRTAHTFSHIFAGGYAAGYYSYKWSEVLSADAYAAFEESAMTDGSPNPDTGRRYREAILEAGGSRPALASFVAFRGREPSLSALLRHQGMDESSPVGQ